MSSSHQVNHLSSPRYYPIPPLPLPDQSPPSSPPLNLWRRRRQDTQNGSHSHHNPPPTPLPPPCPKTLLGDPNLQAGNLRNSSVLISNENSPPPSRATTESEASNLSSTETANASTNPTSNRSFRLNAQNLFLTFPQCNLSKEQAAQNLQSKHSIEWAVIVQEQHQDGNPHLHIALRLKKKANFKDPRVFDHVGEKHGNYQGINSIGKTLAYIRKFDKTPFTIGSPPEPKEVKEKVSDSIALRLLKKEKLEAVIEDHPGFVMMNLKKLQDFQNYTEVQTMIKTVPAWSMPQWNPVTHNPDPTMTILLEWCRDNIRTTAPRAHRTPQLYIWGKTEMGKTRFAQLITTNLRVYYYPDEDWFDSYHDDAYDIVLMNEARLTPKHDISTLLQFIEGCHMSLKRRGTCPIIKKKNLPMIFCSNYPPQDLMKDHVQREAFNSRLLVVNVQVPIDWPHLHIEYEVPHSVFDDL